MNIEERKEMVLLRKGVERIASAMEQVLELAKKETAQQINTPEKSDDYCKPQ